jgi:hypothetical protein
MTEVDDVPAENPPCPCPRCQPKLHIHHCGRINCTGTCRQTGDEPMLHLSSSSLLSKYGFDDGAIPEQVLDYLDDHAIAYPDNWHAILITLVRAHLLPELAKHHTVEVEEIGTHHNPIRAHSVDGAPIDTDLLWMNLTPESVLVPMSTMAHEVRKQHQQGALDLGHDHWLRWASWSPDRDLNPQYADLPDVERAHAMIDHPRASDPTKRCVGGVIPDTAPLHIIAGRATWHVESLEPLTLSPSILCSCGDHGFIRDGRWIPA